MGDLEARVAAAHAAAVADIAGHVGAGRVGAVRLVHLTAYADADPAATLAAAVATARDLLGPGGPVVGAAGEDADGDAEEAPGDPRPVGGDPARGLTVSWRTDAGLALVEALRAAPGATPFRRIVVAGERGTLSHDTTAEVAR